MLSITKPGPNRVDIDLQGSIDADTMRKGLDDLLDFSEDVTHGRMLYRISEFAMPSFAALGVEFVRIPKLFSLLGKFDKCAVVTDAAWLRKAAEIEGALFPGLDIKAFGAEEVDAAEAWLADPA